MGHESPRARNYCHKGHYPTVLDRINQAGMLSWSAGKFEDLEYQTLADRITMTLFAVKKDDNCDRLISWPRMQNDFILNAPYVDLPTPNLFQNIRTATHGFLLGFYLDTSNKFHCIRLSYSFTKLLPMKLFRYSALSAVTRKA